MQESAEARFANVAKAQRVVFSELQRLILGPTHERSDTGRQLRLLGDSPQVDGNRQVVVHLVLRKHDMAFHVRLEDGVLQVPNRRPFLLFFFRFLASIRRCKRDEQFPSLVVAEQLFSYLAEPSGGRRSRQFQQELNIFLKCSLSRIGRPEKPSRRGGIIKQEHLGMKILFQRLAATFFGAGQALAIDNNIRHAKALVFRQHIRFNSFQLNTTAQYLRNLIDVASKSTERIGVQKRRKAQ